MGSTSPGSFLGRQVDAVGSGAAAEITKFEAGESWRAQENQNWVSLAPGLYTAWAITSTQHVVVVDPNAGQVAIAGFAATGGNAGNWFVIWNGGTGSDEVSLAHDSILEGTATNRILCPGNINYSLSPGEGALVQYVDNSIATSGTAGTSLRWRVVDRVPLTAPGEMLGLQIDAIGSARRAVALTGLEQGENIKFDTRQDDTTSTGSIATYTLTDSTINLVLFSTGAGDMTIHGISGGTAGRRVRFQCTRTLASRIVFANESATAGATAQRIQGPREFSIAITGGEAVVLVYDGTSSRWRFEGSIVRTGNLSGELEVTATGTINNQARDLDERIFVFTGAAPVLTGLASGPRGDLTVIGPQATTLQVNDNGGTSSAGNRFAHKGDYNHVYGDDDYALYIKASINTGLADTRWVCLSHRYPFVNTTANAAGDRIEHTGTDWDVVPVTSGAGTYGLGGVSVNTSSQASTSGGTGNVAAGGTYSIPANTLRVGSLYKLTAYYTISGGASLPQVRALVTIGASTASATMAASASTTGIGRVEMLIRCSALGAPGTFSVNGAIESNYGTTVYTGQNISGTTTGALSISLTLNSVTSIAGVVLSVNQGAVERIF